MFADHRAGSAGRAPHPASRRSRGQNRLQARAHLQPDERRQFPKALRLGVRAVGWDSAEVEQWIADRLDERA